MLNSLQALRAIAAWMVVFYHIIQSYGIDDVSANLFWHFISQYGPFGVDIFFVISGFIMALVSQKYHGKGIVFLINRLFRIFPVYWFYTALMLVSILLLPASTYITDWNVASLLKSMVLLPHANPNTNDVLNGMFPLLYVGWTLTFEMIFYVIFSVVLMLKIPRPELFCALGFFVGGLVFRNYYPLGHPSFLFLEFSAGIILFSIYNAFSSDNSKQLLLSASAAIVLFAAVFVLLNRSFLMEIAIAFMLVALFVYANRFLNNSNFIVKALRALGDYSYSTYLAHAVVIGWGYHFVKTNELAIDDVYAVSIIVTLTFAVSLFSYFYVENNSWIRHIKNSLIRRFG